MDVYNKLKTYFLAGISAHSCIETLRTHGYTGEITMISKDTKLPYDKR